MASKAQLLFVHNVKFALALCTQTFKKNQAQTVVSSKAIRAKMLNIFFKEKEYISKMKKTIFM